MMSAVPSVFAPSPCSSSAVAFAPLGGPRLVVIDSGVIYDDIVHRLRYPHKQHVLIKAARAGAIRLFAGDHVYDEIYDSLDGHERRGIVREHLVTCFERVYLPHLRFVSTPLWPVGDRVLAVAKTDPDDVQTASLAHLLAPSLVFAVDPHLVDAGFGRADDWLTLAWQADELLGFDGTLLLAGLAARGTANWVANLYRRHAADIGGREMVGLLLALGLYLAAPATSRTIAAHVERVAKAVGQAAGYTVLGVGQVAAESGQRHSALSAASVASEPRPDAASRIARHLAAIDRPLPLVELAAAVGVAATHAARVLDGHPAFIFDSRGWQIGRRRLPRGRELEMGTGSERAVVRPMEEERGEGRQERQQQT